MKPYDVDRMSWTAPWWTEIDALVVGATGSVAAPADLVLGEVDDCGNVRLVARASVPSRLRPALAGRLKAAGGTRRAPAVAVGLPGSTSGYETLGKRGADHIRDEAEAP